MNRPARRSFGSGQEKTLLCGRQESLRPLDGGDRNLRPALHRVWWGVLFLFLLTAAGCAGGKAILKPKAAPPPQPAPATAERIVETARQLIGTPYRSGGADPKEGFDCSGLVYWVFSQHGLELPRQASQQFQAGQPVKSSQLRPADLLFFHTAKTGWWSKKATHVGIYTGAGTFIHAAKNGHRVRESRLNGTYWERCFLGARRFLP
jgi:cell wall-associated NlpC family hydrolase